MSKVLQVRQDMCRKFHDFRKSHRQATCHFGPAIGDVDRKLDLPTIAMPTFPKCRRQTLLRRWSDMYNKTDTVKANVGIHWWTIGCTPPNLHNWEPGLTQEWARSYRFARTCVKSSTTFSRVTYKPHAIHLNRAPPEDQCQEIHMHTNNFHGFHPCRIVSHRENINGF